jgi:hypothetical protein
LEIDKTEYVKFAISNVNTYIKKIREELKKAIDEIGVMQRNLAEKIKMYNQFCKTIEGYDEAKYAKEAEEKSLKDFIDVEKLPQVKSIFVKDGKIHIYTNDIRVEDDRSKKIHDLGNFHIQLNMLSETFSPDSSIVIKNLKHPLTGGYGDVQEAPHVFNGGHLCHGNMSNTMIECYANRDVYALVSAIIFFLESANTGDYAGANVNRWPEYIEKVETKVSDETDDELSDALATKVKGS